jgi:hypothetical protein
MHKCGKVVDSNLVKRVVSYVLNVLFDTCLLNHYGLLRDSGINTVRPEAYKKYTHFITKGFVDQNPNMQWCPAPGCTNAVLCELSTGTRHAHSFSHTM